jgi:dephospho-CoA kinase
MGGWPGKYVIGLTGNIATGKSVVRKMLEHLGAYGIDADALGHRAIAKGAPGYHSVLNTFGKWILGPDGQIDRAKLARIVFADPEALNRLEAIVHPLVRQAVDILVRRSKERVIVIEAIKLLESPLRQSCDILWTTFTPPEIQLSRLIQKRGMTEITARQRIAAQPPQEEKLAAAKVVILNLGSFEDTWQQVSTAWIELFPADATVILMPTTATPKGQMVVEKTRPQHAAEIAALINRLSIDQRTLSSEDVMAAFGEKAFLFLKIDNQPVGLVGWQVENLVACTDDVYIDTGLPLSNAMQTLLTAVERSSRDLQCEVILLFIPEAIAQQTDVWSSLGYELRTLQTLGVRAWQEAAQETIGVGEAMYFKQLRKDRVLKPV